MSERILYSEQKENYLMQCILKKNLSNAVMSASIHFRSPNKSQKAYTVNPPRTQLAVLSTNIHTHHAINKLNLFYNVICEHTQFIEVFTTDVKRIVHWKSFLYAVQICRNNTVSILFRHTMYATCKSRLNSPHPAETKRINKNFDSIFGAVLPYKHLQLFTKTKHWG